MYMDGRAVFRWAVAILCDTIQDVLGGQEFQARGCQTLHSPSGQHSHHQCRLRCAAHPAHKVFNNLEKYGNTSAGSVPLALDEALAEGRIKSDDLVVLSGFGAGLAWGTALVRW